MTRALRLTRRQALAATAVTPLALVASGEGALLPPNIVFILADDLGYADLSCYGRRDYQTPHIDRLAAEGVRFTQAYANSAVCSATRTALITGRYQYRLAVGLEALGEQPAAQCRFSRRRARLLHAQVRTGEHRHR